MIGQLKYRIGKCIIRNLIIPLGLLLLCVTTTLAENVNEDLIYIPVVFHVVYHLDEENVSDEQIQSQLNALNLDYRARNEDIINVDAEFQGSIRDSQIEFILADRIATFPIAPIQRVKTETQVFFNSALFESANGGSDPIEKDRILNIWVANLAEGLLGFYDQSGVAVDFKSFGTVGTASSPYALGRTLTHELGHFFTLSHLWGNGGCDSDDDVVDTPNQSTEIGSCDLDSNSCGSKDMTQNFMNIASDDCLLFFTKGQVKKMRTYISEELSDMVLVQEDIILNIETESKAINFYPNPSKDGTFYLENRPSQELVLEIFSIGGKLMDRYSVTGTSIHLNNLDKGVYLVLINQKNVKNVSKIVIE